MNERIKKELIENLKLSECQDITEKINKCNQINTDINSLQNNINELLHDLIFEKWETEINRLNKNAFAKITPYDECKCHELNIEVETYVGKKEIFITDGEASYLWWGIKKNENNSIEEFFEKIDKHFDGVKNEYYLWKKTTYSDGLKELLEIIDLLQSK